MELDPSARDFLQKKVDELLDLFTNTRSRVTPDFADEALATTPATTSSTTPPPAPTDEAAPLGRLLRRDLDPTRSVFSQRVERQMERTGMTEEEAREAVRNRRAEREERLGNLQEELGLSRRKARPILKYGDRNRTKNEDGTTADANYNRARRVIEFARKKGLKRSEAESILRSRGEARRKANES